MGLSREAARYMGGGWKLRELGHQVSGSFGSQDWKNEKSPQVPKYLNLQLRLTGHPEVSIRDEKGSAKCLNCLELHRGPTGLFFFFQKLLKQINLLKKTLIGHCKIDVIFKSNFRFTEKLSGRSRDCPYTLWPHMAPHYQHPPPGWSIYYNWWTCPGTSLSP